MTRYTVRPARPRGSVFWNVVTAVVIIAALAAVSEALAVSVVTAAMVCWLAVAVVRAVRR